MPGKLSLKFDIYNAKYIHIIYILYLCVFNVFFIILDIVFSNGQTGNYLFLGNFVYTVSMC